MKDIVKKLSLETGLDLGTVNKIMQTAPIRYKTYFIPKRNGEKRRISQPAREVKALQRALIEILLQHLPVHEAAKAYRKGMSIRDNAAAHVHSGPIVKMDFKDFFPSIKRSDWVKYCEQTSCIEDNVDIDLTANLLFQKQDGYKTLRLAIGAPSSPILSNILMYEFDSKISEALSDTKIIYTRYADDLTFSAPRTGYIHDVKRIVPSILNSIRSPRLELNHDKTTYVTKKFGRRITGLVISNDETVTIGWRKKRDLHAAVHHAVLGKLDKSKIQALAGMLAFVNAVEPQFIEKLSEKYGEEAIVRIKRLTALKKS